jgi:hypothetical protein
LKIQNVSEISQIPGKKGKIKDDTKTVDCKKKYEETQERLFQFS